MLECLEIKEHKMPDGRHNVIRYEVETIASGGATFYIKRKIEFLRLEVSGEDWWVWCNHA